MTRKFGRAELPESQAKNLRQAVRIQWFTIGFLVVTITVIYLVMGSSQAMKTAWIEDILSLAPPIGSISLFGELIWLGWLMMAVMALTIPLPIYFGRVKQRLAKELHDKVLYADAAMNKADWMTAAGSIVGVAGIGRGRSGHGCATKATSFTLSRSWYPREA